MKPLVSILVPAYNAQEWLAETLRSALDQRWEPKEIIVVDDGSTDGTLAIARQFETRQVRVVSQENQGASAARNRCFSLSQGDYIQWLDADDLLAPDKISRQMELQNVTNRTLLSSEWAWFFYRPQRARFEPSALWCDLSPVEWLLRKLGGNLQMQTATWLVSRELTEIVGLWNTGLMVDDDGEYFCRALLASDGVKFVPGARVYYRQGRPGSCSYIGYSKPKRVAQWKSMESHIRYIRSLEDTDRVRAACIQYLQDWLFWFYPELPELVDQAKELANTLGGSLVEPKLSWKYSWIRTVFGWKLAKRAKLGLPNFRASMLRSWDRIMLRVEHRALATNSGHYAA